MKKKTKIALITTVTIVALAAIGVMIYQGNLPDMSNLVAIENREETEKPEVVAPAPVSLEDDPPL